MGTLVSKITRATIGVNVSPHLFRTAAASTSAIYGGNTPYLTSALLQHTDPRVTPLDTAFDRLMHIAPIHAAGKKLYDVIKGCRRYLFVFLGDRAIPPTNNGSEQALRPCVIFRKVTNCFRSQWGANLYADIRSTIETARRRAIGALEAIRLTLNGTPLPVPATPLSR
jgi:hypothetical protein